MVGASIKKAQAILEVALPVGTTFMRTPGMDYVRMHILEVYMDTPGEGKYELGNFFTCVRVW